MLATKKAIEAKAIGDTTLMTLLGGGTVYQRAPQIDIASLVTGTKSLVTFSMLSESSDSDVPYSEEVIQFDAWAKTSDAADAIAERIVTLFEWKYGVSGSGTLPSLSGRRLAMPITREPAQPEQDEALDATITLYHRIRIFRVATYAA